MAFTTLPDVTTITAAQILGLLQAAGVRATVNTIDRVYRMPTRRWVVGEFARAFSSLVRKLGFTAKAESQDCDDFARLACVYLGILNARARAQQEAAIAAGEFGYYEPGLGTFGGYHAIVCVVTRDRPEDPLGLAFFEPQPNSFGLCMTERNLTATNVDSCIYCRF